MENYTQIYFILRHRKGESHAKEITEIEYVIGIADICNTVAISARTANRILNKLKDDRIVRFSVICDPKAMKVQYFQL